jgi:hypothetical protein
MEKAVIGRLKHQSRFLANIGPDLEAVIASEAKQSRDTSGMREWIVSLRSQ